MFRGQMFIEIIMDWSIIFWVHDTHMPKTCVSFCSFQACEECKTHGDLVFVGLAGFGGVLAIMGVNLDPNTTKWWLQNEGLNGDSSDVSGSETWEMANGGCNGRGWAMREGKIICSPAHVVSLCLFLSFFLSLFGVYAVVLVEVG